MKTKNLLAHSSAKEISSRIIGAAQLNLNPTVQSHNAKLIIHAVLMALTELRDQAGVKQELTVDRLLKSLYVERLSDLLLDCRISEPTKSALRNVWGALGGKEGNLSMDKQHPHLWDHFGQAISLLLWTLMSDEFWEAEAGSDGK